MLAGGGEDAIERVFFRWTETQLVIEPRHCEVRCQRQNRDAVGGEPQAPCFLAIANARGQHPERRIPKRVKHRAAGAGQRAAQEQQGQGRKRISRSHAGAQPQEQERAFAECQIVGIKVRLRNISVGAAAAV